MRRINENTMRMVNGGDNVQEVIIGGSIFAKNFVLVQKQNVYTKVTKVNVNVGIKIKKYW